LKLEIIVKKFSNERKLVFSYEYNEAEYELKNSYRSVVLRLPVTREGFCSIYVEAVK
jgi:hypothetical protein